MSRKKRIYNAIVGCILFICIVGTVCFYEYQGREKKEVAQVEIAQKFIQVLESEKVKTELNEIHKKAETLYKQIQELKQGVAGLFKDDEKSDLTDEVTRETIDYLKKQTEEITLQKAVQENLQKDIEKAYQLIEKKEQELKAQQQREQAERKKAESTVSTDSSNNQLIVERMNLSNQTNQIVTVVASGSSAIVTFWQKSNAGWGQVFSTYGQVGSQGVGPADEYHSYTPRGAYSLGFAFGTNNPGTSLNFRQITSSSYWISNVDDPDYNTWQEREYSSSADEHLASYSSAYQYAVVINYNTACVRGGGSAFFLHCGNGSATAGCVAIPTNYMRQALQLLQPGVYS